uniref:Putative ovule protein n=1 Tax=Solanum chacoense TaxID=4108 RepID=A0A0V0I4N1_SOLCH
MQPVLCSYYVVAFSLPHFLAGLSLSVQLVFVDFLKTQVLLVWKPSSFFLKIACCCIFFLCFVQDSYLLYNQIKQQEINVITGRIYGCDDNAIFEQYELGIEMISAVSWRGYQER